MGMYNSFKPKKSVKKPFRWTGEYDHMLGMVSDVRMKQLTGMSRCRICWIRKERGIPAYNKHAVIQARERILFDQGLSNEEIGAILKRSTGFVHIRRYLYQTCCETPVNRLPRNIRRVYWTEDMIAWLGVESDYELAKRYGLSLYAVVEKRHSLGIYHNRKAYKNMRKRKRQLLGVCA